MTLYGVTPGAVSQIVRGLKWVEQSVARENAA